MCEHFSKLSSIALRSNRSLLLQIKYISSTNPLDNKIIFETKTRRITVLETDFCKNEKFINKFINLSPSSIFLYTKRKQIGEIEGKN